MVEFKKINKLMNGAPLNEWCWLSNKVIDESCWIRG